MAPASLSKLQGTLPLSTAATPRLQTAVWDSLDGVYNVIHRGGAGPDLLALHLRDRVTRLEARPVCHRPLNHLWDPDPRQEARFNYANRADLQQRWLGVSAGADMCCIRMLQLVQQHAHSLKQAHQRRCVCHSCAHLGQQDGHGKDAGGKGASRH